MSMDTIIKLENLNIYQDNNLILENINLTIDKGQLVFFIGKVGSGKSSLLKTLYAELPVNTGYIEVCGMHLNNLKRKKRPELRKKLGIVFQDFQLLTDRNIFENLEFVLKATGWNKKTEITTRINEVLDKVNLSNKILSMPHQLSGGEQQRIAIARTLLNNPEAILADEPTGNLDPETSKEILGILTEIQQSGRAIIIATHDYELLKLHPSTTYKFEEQKVTQIN